MSRNPKPGAFINCKVRLDIVERLNEYSEQTRIPKTAIVEFALIEYLDKVAPKKAKELLPETVD
jgi:hypothetical protein